MFWAMSTDSRPVRKRWIGDGRLSLGRDEEAQQSFGAYLSLVSDKEMPAWRQRFVSRAKTELGR